MARETLDERTHDVPAKHDVEAALLQVAKVKETAERVANGDSSAEADQIRVRRRPRASAGRADRASLCRDAGTHGRGFNSCERA